jgi:hypothetical protein
MASFAVEKHYRVKELALIWGLSPKTVSRLFANEPGVIRVANDLTNRRKYATLSIPESVVSRVHERLGTPPAERAENHAASVRIIRLGDAAPDAAGNARTVVKRRGRSNVRRPGANRSLAYLGTSASATNRSSRRLRVPIHFA